MSDDLVERVIDAMSNCGSETVGSRMARAAIALLRPAIRAEALEEAAKVCDACPDSHWGPTMAAAIRAMIGRESHE